MTFHDLKWPWDHEEESMVAIFRFRVSILRECLEWFSSKTGAFKFYPTFYEVTREVTWEHLLSQETKESERKSISDRCPITVQQQVITLAVTLDNAYASWSCSTIIGCWSEMLFLSLSFCLLTDPVLRTFCTTAHDVEAFDAIFSGKSVYISLRLMSIEPMTALNLYSSVN